MKTHVTLLALVLVAALVGGLVALAVPATAGDDAFSIGPHPWKGTTDKTLLTDAGHAAMNAACVAEFPGTRICTEQEVFLTTPMPAAGKDGFIIAGSGGGIVIGNTPILLTSYGFGQVNNCHEPGGVFKTKKVGTAMFLGGDGIVKTDSCKDIYNDGGMGVACCGR